MVIFLDVFLNIIKINQVLEDYFKCNIYDLFLNCYCLDYYRILTSIYPDGVLVLEKNKEHCACMINEVIYDVSGIRDVNDFVLANENDINFVYSFYNRLSNEEINDIIEHINGCVKKKKIV